MFKASLKLGKGVSGKEKAISLRLEEVFGDSNLRLKDDYDNGLYSSNKEE